MLKRILTLLLVLAPLAWPASRAAAAEATGSPAKVAAAESEPREHGVMEFDLASAVWTLIIFLIVLAILYPTAWKQVLAALKAREQRIRSAIADAEAAHLKAEATLKEYNAQLATAASKAQEIIAKAMVDAQAVADRIRVQAQKDSEEAKERATRDIAEARDQALREVYQQAAVLATSVAEKILRRSLNPDDQRDLVAQGIEQLQAVNRG